MKEKILILLAMAMLVGGCSIKARVKRADKKFAIGEYYDAADMYKSVYGRISPKTDKPLKAHVAFNQGECYRILNHPRAVNCYQNAVRNKYQDSIVYLRFAQVQHYQGKYKEADKNYQIYLQSHPTDYLALSGHLACMQVSDWKKTTSRYKVREAREFNAKRSSNFAPCFIGGDDALMFTSNRSQTSQKKKLLRPSPVTGAQLFSLWQTRKNAKGQWEEIMQAEGLGSGMEEDEQKQQNDSTADKAGKAEMGACCFTADGRTMYFTYSKPINGQDLGANIYKSSRASGEWGEPTKVELFRDSSITVGHPALSVDGDTLWFASDAPGGFGGKDIWWVEMDGEQLGIPQNAGPSINTSGDEMYPSIAPDRSLWFASNGHAGYGGLDLYRATLDTLYTDSVVYTVWNMGNPFNSSGDDFGITFNEEGHAGFFSSNRNEKKGIDKIYAWELPEMEFVLTGLITDNQGEPISDAMIRMVGDDGTNMRMAVRRDGTYRIKLKKETRYALLATARGYLNAREQVNTLGVTDSKEYQRTMSLAPISRPVAMDNIFYEFGKWELTKESETGLQTLVKLLNDNPNITIELSAHTDMKGDSVFNLNLSQKRAQSVCDYLVKAGIARDRLTPVGYGKQKPVVADQAMHKQYPFIPQEQVLSPEFILTLPEAQQEICNQINRRTEFKVLKTTYKLY